MEEIIKINQDDGLGQVVSARELYEFLEVKTAFKDWMPRMLEYGFEEGVDFCSFLSGSTGGRPSRDYALTLDTAKEISMIQRNDKGRQARRYFIACEKAATASLPNIVLKIDQERNMLIQEAKKIEKRIDELENAKRYITGVKDAEYWQTSFEKMYGKHTYSFINSNISKWISEGMVAPSLFRDEYKKSGGDLGITTLYRSIREYCIWHDFVFTNSKMTGRHPRRRMHVFTKK